MGVLLTLQKHRKNESDPSDSKVTPAGRPQSDLKIDSKAPILSHFWAAFESRGLTLGWDFGSHFWVTLGHFNSFCVSIELVRSTPASQLYGGYSLYPIPFMTQEMGLGVSLFERFVDSVGLPPSVLVEQRPHAQQHRRVSEHQLLRLIWDRGISEGTHLKGDAQSTQEKPSSQLQPEGRNVRGGTRLRGPEVLGPLRGLGEFDPSFQQVGSQKPHFRGALPQRRRSHPKKIKQGQDMPKGQTVPFHVATGGSSKPLLSNGFRQSNSWNLRGESSPPPNFTGGKSTRKNRPKIKSSSEQVFSEQLPLGSWLVSQGRRQKFAWSFRKSSRRRAVFCYFVILGGFLGL